MEPTIPAQTLMEMVFSNINARSAPVDINTFELSRIELDRPGPHYTLDTVKVIAEQNPNTDIVPIIGGDSLRDLPKWHEPQKLVYACLWIGVMRRPHDISQQV